VASQAQESEIQSDKGEKMRRLFSIRALLGFIGVLVLSGVAYAQVDVGIAVSFGPPELPVYEQPICPAEGYIWTPGYWAWDGEDYYWVPGTWVAAPRPGYLWTPAYWAWGGRGYYFHEGYWGPEVGFYGGINYGFGYFGHGYEGGRWEHDHFYYNRSVNNVNEREIHNTYNTTVVNNYGRSRVSYNGGRGGINEHPNSGEEAANRERHIGPVAEQTHHMEAARGNPELRASSNHGRPPIAATSRPGSFSGHEAVAATEGGHYDRPPQSQNSGGQAERAIHANELSPHTRPQSPNTGNPNRDQKYQQQQDKLYAKQQQDHVKLQQRQEQDHQRLEQQRANDAKMQQVEQQHQQQTQQMAQRHEQQQQHMQQQQQQQSHQQPHQDSHQNQPKGKP
jgi:hypothetical protein